MLVVPPNEHPKTGLRIGFLNNMEDILNAFLSLFQIAG